MSKPGRSPRKIILTTGEDPALWRYRNACEALVANIPLLATLIAVDPKIPERPPCEVPENLPSTSQDTRP